MLIINILHFQSYGYKSYKGICVLSRKRKKILKKNLDFYFKKVVYIADF